jgi:hypothetical protein
MGDIVSEPPLASARVTLLIGFLSIEHGISWCHRAIKVFLATPRTFPSSGAGTESQVRV